MKRILLCILAFIIVSSVFCFSSCEKDSTDTFSAAESNLEQNTPEKKYIVTEDRKVTFDVAKDTIVIVEDNPRAPLIETIVVQEDTVKVVSVFEDEPEEKMNFEYRISKNGGKITAFSSETSNAKIEYDEKNRISKISFVTSENTCVYSFSYSESGIMTITSDSNADMTLYGHKDFVGIISSEVIDSVAVENNELLIKLSGNEKTCSIEEVSAEELEMFSTWNLIDFILELYTTFDRGFLLEE